MARKTLNNWITTIYLPKRVIELIDQLVAEGWYGSRNQFIREAVNFYLPIKLRDIGVYAKISGGIKKA